MLSSLSGSGRFSMLSRESRMRVSCTRRLRLVRGSVNYSGLRFYSRSTPSKMRAMRMGM
jgi:hypothetical protein